MAPMNREEAVAAVILAAGRGTRFGSPKALVRVGSRSLLQIAADAVTAAGLAPVLAVVPPGLTVPAGVTPVINAAPELGMSRSLRLGIAAVPPDAEAAIVTLVDQPTVDAVHLQRLLGARGGTPVLATRAGDVIGAPVLLERAAFSLVERAGGDAGLRHVLRDDPSLVRSVTFEQPIPDVDAPADLERITEPCPGCGARFLPHGHDEAHPYIGASPACWAAYGELLAREFEDSVYGQVHRHSADVYAVQHPGSEGRRQRQSVALHLVALCHWLEYDLEMERLNAITQRLAGESREWPWLPPPAAYPMTVVDVLQARRGLDHVELVRRWAETTWTAWNAHQDLVRDWARKALA
jgi:CTP:molybdopterin cytidylyltransferase MocA